MDSVVPLRLDPTTLLFSISLLGFVTAGFAFSASRAIGAKQDGLVEWGQAMAAVGGAFLLLFLRGHAPMFLTYVVANGLMLAVAVFGLLAHTTFFAAPPPRRTIAALCAFGMSGILGVYLFDLPRGLAVFTMCVPLAVLLALIGRIIVRNNGWRISKPSTFAAVTVFLLALVCVYRAVMSALGSGATVTLAANNNPNSLTLVCGTLYVVGASIGFVMMVHERQRRVELQSSRRDVLTGLHTRAAFLEAATAVQAQVSEAYALVVVDIDNFKAINDNHGHSGGDHVLTHLGRLILRSIRSSDIAGRYGGDEFCIILRACGQAEAQRFAERLVLEAGQQSLRLPSGAACAFTISAGYATRLPGPVAGGAMELTSEVFDRADAALYEAKRRGRTRAVGAVEAPPAAGADRSAPAARSTADAPRRAVDLVER